MTYIPQTIHNLFAKRTPSPSKPPVLLKYRSSETFIVLTVCIAIFTDVLLYAGIVPVIPFALTDRVGIPQHDVQHQVSVLLAVYGAALLVGSPICGVLSDRMPNRRLPMLLGLLALAGGTLLFCLGHNMAMLLTARVLQGVSAAVVWTVGLALVADTVGHQSIGQALGYVSISMSLGNVFAPMLGGIVYDRAGYYAVYYMFFCVILLDISLRMVLVERKVAQEWLTMGAQQAEERSIPTNSEYDGSNRPLLAKPPSQRSSKPREALWFLFSSRRLCVALICSLIGAVLLTVWDATLPLYVNRLFGWSSLGGGLVFLPLAIPSFFAPLVGLWADKKGPRWPIVIGSTFAIPFIVLLRLVVHSGSQQIVLLCAMLVLIGIGIHLALTPLGVEISNIVREKEKLDPGAFGGRGAYATAYGLYNTAFAGGMLVGPLLGGFVNQGAGWGTMCWTLAMLSFCSAVLAWLFIGESPLLRRERRDGQVGEEAGV